LRLSSHYYGVVNRTVAPSVDEELYERPGSPDGSSSFSRLAYIELKFPKRKQQHSEQHARACCRWSVYFPVGRRRDNNRGRRTLCPRSTTPLLLNKASRRSVGEALSMIIASVPKQTKAHTFAARCDMTSATAHPRFVAPFILSPLRYAGSACVDRTNERNAR
jgi:hypothetical protein